MTELSAAFPTGVIENSGIQSSLETCVFTGVVSNLQEWTESSVSGGGGGGSTGPHGSVSVAPIQTTHHRLVKFWLNNTETGGEMVVQLNANTLVVREGQTLSIIYSNKRKTIDYMRAVNHSMGHYYILSKSAASYIYATLAGKIFFATVAIFIASFWLTFPRGTENWIPVIISLPVISYLYMHLRRWEVNKQLDELSMQVLEHQPLKATEYGAKARTFFMMGVVVYILFLVLAL